MTKIGCYITLSIICLLLLSISCGCGDDSVAPLPTATNNPTQATNPFEATLIRNDAGGNTVEKISYDFFRIDKNGNVIACSTDSQIDPNNYFYFWGQTEDSTDQFKHFPDEEDYTDLFQEYAGNYGTGEELYRFLTTYEISPICLYKIYNENPGQLIEIISFWKYLHDNYLMAEGNENYDPEDIADFFSYHNIKLSDFPSDPESFFEKLKNNNLTFGDFITLFCEIGNIPLEKNDNQVFLTPKEKLQAINELLDIKNTGELQGKGFILSLLADIAIEALVDMIVDLITGTPTQLANFREQPIDCYAKINGQTIQNSKYYSGGKVVSTDPYPYTFTTGALWWYNELNFTITTMGTIKNIYDGDQNGIDDEDIAKWGVFGRQITTKGTNVTANRVHDIELKFKIIDKQKLSIAVPTGAIDTDFPSTDIPLTAGQTPAKFIIVGEYVVTWKCRGFWGQVWQSDACRFTKKVYVDTMQGIKYDSPF